MNTSTLRSRILEELGRSRVTGRKKAVIGPLKFEESYQNLIYETMDEYDLTCTIGSKYFIRNGEGNLKYFMETMVDQVLDFIFRDAKDRLRELEIAYLTEDNTKIKDAFAEMWKSLS